MGYQNLACDLLLSRKAFVTRWVVFFRAQMIRSLRQCRTRAARQCRRLPTMPASFVIPRSEALLACPDDERSSEEWEESLPSPKISGSFRRARSLREEESAPLLHHGSLSAFLVGMQIVAEAFETRNLKLETTHLKPAHPPSAETAASALLKGTKPQRSSWPAREYAHQSAQRHPGRVDIHAPARSRTSPDHRC